MLWRRSAPGGHWARSARTKLATGSLLPLGGGGKWGYVEPKFQAVYTFSGKAAVVKP